MPRRKNPAPADPAPDPAAAAARVMGEGEDAPRPAPLSNAERQRRHKAKKRAAANPEPANIVVTVGDVETAAAIGDTIWTLVGPYARLAPLNPEQRNRLGGALAPLIVKYMPLVGQWQHEVTAVFVVMSLARETYIPKGASNGSPASTETGAAATTRAVDNGGDIQDGRGGSAEHLPDGARARGNDLVAPSPGADSVDN